MHIYYEGTKAQFDAVVISDDNGKLVNKESVIHYETGVQVADGENVFADCYSAGYTTKVCELCGTVFMLEELPATGHNFTAEVEDIQYAISSGTCQVKATYYKSCVYCGECSYDETFEGGYNMNIHASDETVVLDTIPANCISTGFEGKEIYSCCGAEKNPGTVIPVDSTNHAREELELLGEIKATCKTTGYTGNLIYSCCKAVYAYGEETAVNPENHMYEAAKINVKAATCKEKGYTGDDLYYCCYAKVENGVETPVNPENHAGFAEKVREKTATCITKGYTGDVEYSCCNAVVEAGVVTEFDALNHEGTPSSIKNAVSATCIAEGYEGDIHYSCCDAFCSKGKTTGIDPDNHCSVETMYNAEPDCKDFGFDKHSYCYDCEKEIELVGYVPALGHDFTVESPVDDCMIIPATCTTYGVFYKTCSRCGCSAEDKALSFENIAGGYNLSNHSSEETKLVNVKAESCISVGYTGDEVYVCCDGIKTAGSVIPVNAAKHESTETRLINVKTATCTETGYTGDTVYICCEAEFSKGAVIAKDAANHTDTGTKLINVKAATCTDEGFTGDEVYVCCEAIKNAGSVIAAAGHSWGDYETVIEATTENDGLQVRVCSGCDIEDSKVLPKLSKIEITETESVKVVESLPDVFVADSITASTLAQSVSAGAEIVDKNGNTVEENKTIGTGMKIVIRDGDKIVDEKVIVVPFDVDGDGTSTAADARLALRQSVKLESLADYQISAADVSDKSTAGIINASDARAILRASVKLEDKSEWFKNNIK